MDLGRVGASRRPRRHLAEGSRGRCTMPPA